MATKTPPRLLQTFGSEPTRTSYQIKGSRYFVYGYILSKPINISRLTILIHWMSWLISCCVSLVSSVSLHYWQCPSNFYSQLVQCIRICSQLLFIVLGITLKPSVNNFYFNMNLTIPRQKPFKTTKTTDQCWSFKPKSFKSFKKQKCSSLQKSLLIILAMIVSIGIRYKENRCCEINYSNFFIYAYKAAGNQLRFLLRLASAACLRLRCGLVVTCAPSSSAAPAMSLHAESWRQTSY